MTKREELTDPTSCMSRAADDEMTFVLLGRDSAAAATIRFWCYRRVWEGKNTRNDAQIIEAIECADKMDRDRQRKLFESVNPPPSSGTAASRGD